MLRRGVDAAIAVAVAAFRCCLAQHEAVDAPLESAMPAVTVMVMMVMVIAVRSRR